MYGGKLLTSAGPDWSEVDRSGDSKSLTVHLRRQDGLLQKRELTIDDAYRVSFNVEISLPEGATTTEYSETPVLFSEADVKFDGVPLGKAYSLGRPLELKNLGNKPISVRVDVLIPSPQQLKEGAQPIRKTSWIEIRPDRFDIPPHGSASCAVIITVPKKWAHRHELYQAMIWSQSTPVRGSHGLSMNAGLLSRLRFSTTK